MDIDLRNPEQLAPATGFSHVAICDGWVWLGGQIASDAAGSVLFPGRMEAQFGQAIQNVATALAAAGCRPQDVVKLTYYVTDVDAYRAALTGIGRAYREIFGHHYPASSLFGVARLFEPGAMIEIECVARQPNQPSP
jgi:enamine deaminase RidA (YjgF/YER057c/UK114 family)